LEGSLVNESVAPRRASALLLALALVLAVLPTFGLPDAARAQPSASTTFISEFHYDNAGTDEGEFVEVTAPAGTDLTGWSVVLYNGNGGAPYNTEVLSGVVPDQQGEFGTVVVDYPSNGIQNGSPDGIALVDDGGALVEFLSYEGAFTAVGGAADGLTSTDVGVEQGGGTPIGASIERVGAVPSTWTWESTDTNSKGAVNAGLDLGGGGTPTDVVFVNEFHYDNVGTDVGEFIEVAVTVGTDLSGWSIVRYNGANGEVYTTPSSVDDAEDDLGTLTPTGAIDGYEFVVVEYPSNGLQNGAPDGFALVDADGGVVQFLSYEGAFTAVNGPANGLTSTDVGVSQPSSTPVGASLQLTGTGSVATDFSWVSTTEHTAGAVNTGQTFVTAPPPNQPIVPVCEDLTVARGEADSVTLSASDADGTVVDATITSTPVDGISLVNPTPAPEVGGSFTVDLAAAATLGARDYTVEVTFSNDDDPTPQTATCTVTVTVTLELPADLCEVDPGEFTPIYEIQGDGAATPIDGERIVARGVLTADFSSGSGVGIPTDQGLRGFFIEAIEADRDDDPLTSEGVFVFDFAGNAPGELGDLIHVTGVAGEFRDVTQVSASRHQACDDTGVDTELPPPAELPLPADPFDRAELFEPLESMRVTHPELTVVEFFQLERFGEVRLSSGGVLQNPTNVVDPDDDDAYEAIVLFNRANNIILDDGRTGQNLNRLPLGEVDPLPYVEPGDTLRIGDQLRDHTTVLHFGFGEWRLQPIDIDAITQEFQENRTRPRPETPPEVGGTMTVASFNVLNYFDGDGMGGGFPNARGAVTLSELERQTAKLVDAIKRIDADVVGLIEIENDGGEYQATRTLVEALNDAYGDEVYDFVDTGVIGSDAIKVAYIYKPANVEASGDYAILDSSVDPRFDDSLNRPVLAQTFTELRTNEAVMVAVNHLKSKGSPCAPEDNDPRQGNCNGVRDRAAEAMADWLATNPTGEDAKGTLIIGDLNAYAKEDPIRTLQESGYTDLLDSFAPEGVMPYTYTFDATQGYLDHGLADEELLPFVTGTAAWNINADEVPAIDYQESEGVRYDFNRRFRTPEVAEAYYQPDAFRSSDHDPVLIGLELRPGGPDCRLLPPQAREKNPRCNSGERPMPGPPSPRPRP
jgi:uncharacterized protein